MSAQAARKRTGDFLFLATRVGRAKPGAFVGLLGRIESGCGGQFSRPLAHDVFIRFSRRLKLRVSACTWRPPACVRGNGATAGKDRAGRLGSTRTKRRGAEQSGALAADKCAGNPPPSHARRPQLAGRARARRPVCAQGPLVCSPVCLQVV